MIRILKSPHHDPYINLALEQWIVQRYPHDFCLFLWKNDPCVIIGALQNPFNECYLNALKQDKVALVRRFSGGGAVYQDFGNWIFTFSGPEKYCQKSANFSILLQVLHYFGLKAEQQGRNDIFIEQDHQWFKISGQAFQKKGGVFIQHGTLLYDICLELAQKYLNPASLKLKAKGIASIKARIKNVKDLVPHMSENDFHRALGEAFFQYYSPLDAHQSSAFTIEWIPTEKVFSDGFYQKTIHKLKDWEWIYGQTPQFEQAWEKYFSFGYFKVTYQVHQAHISHIHIETDYLDVPLMKQLQAKLTGLTYTLETIQSFFEQMMQNNPLQENHLEELKNQFLFHL